MQIVKRKVWAAKSTVLPNGKGSFYEYRKCRRKENYLLRKRWEKVKRWGKSSPGVWRHMPLGKPYGLKNHVNPGLRIARPIWEGRLIDANGDVSAREMIDAVFIHSYRTRLMICLFFIFFYSFNRSIAL
jgi:hypothetical protein